VPCHYDAGFTIFLEKFFYSIRNGIFEAFCIIFEAGMNSAVDTLRIVVSGERDFKICKPILGDS
jgi:hypothetical protein